MQRSGLFKALSDNYEIKRALYPGSYIHISPSFYFPEVAYVDTDKKAKKFFLDPSYKHVIGQKKEYSVEPIVRFHGMNFDHDLPEKDRLFDLLISQYAGFVSQACKRYLNINGILIANNSHGDAGMANIDEDYRLIAVINARNKKFYYSDSNLNLYFLPKKKDLKITKEYLYSLKKGISYSKTASHYVFRRIK